MMIAYLFDLYVCMWFCFLNPKLSPFIIHKWVTNRKKPSHYSLTYPRRHQTNNNIIKQRRLWYILRARTKKREREEIRQHRKRKGYWILQWYLYIDHHSCVNFLHIEPTDSNQGTTYDTRIYPNFVSAFGFHKQFHHSE